MKKSQRQEYVDILMKDDEENETKLEFLETLTLAELKALSESKTEESDEEL